MLIWGTKVRRKTVGEGTFFSPAAGRDAPYRLIEARKWFTFFFIPLIPLGVLGTFVECGLTQATYDPAVLDNPTNEAFLEQLTAAIREVVAAVAVAGGVVTERERRAAITVVRAYVSEYDDSMLDADLARADHAPLTARLAYLAGAMAEQGREQVLTAAATVMAADGVVDDGDRALVASLGRQLSMSPAHIRGVIDTATAMSD